MADTAVPDTIIENPILARMEVCCGGRDRNARRLIGRDPHRVDCRSRLVVPTAGDGLSPCAGERR